MASGKRKPRPPGSADSDPLTSRRDENLIRGVVAGDAGSLRELIEQYDRLIRYTIFRSCGDECRKDPTFLDGIASEVWSGFVESVRRRGTDSTSSLKSYLVQIARNKCHDHLRRAGRELPTQPADAVATSDNREPADSAADPSALLIRLEQLQTMRDCIRELPPSDRNLLEHMDLIAESRWSEVARRLNVPESTLRSRWNRVVEELRAKMGRKPE